MTDDLDRALREQARTFGATNDGAAPGLDDVVRRSTARRRARIAGATAVVVLVVGLATVAVAVRPNTSDLATIPDGVPATTTETTAGTTTPPVVPPPSTETTTVLTTPTTAPVPSSTTTASTDPVPTTAPTTTPVADPTCTWPEIGLVVTYPAGWFMDGTGSCTRFDPEPQPEPVAGDSEFVAIWLNQLEEDLPTAIDLFENESINTFVSGERLRFGGYDAYCFQEISTGAGLAPAGLTLDACMVDLPAAVIIFSTLHDPQDPASSHRAEMRWMAEQVRPIA